MEIKKYVAIDVGGTAIKYALMDENYAFHEKDEIVTPSDSYETYINTLLSIVEKYKREISGVAFSMPGQIDASKGYLYTGGYLDKIDMRCH